MLDGSLRGWLAVIDELGELASQRVVPGHGPVSDWPAALSDERRYLETLAADVRTLDQDGRADHGCRRYGRCLRTIAVATVRRLQCAQRNRSILGN